ncbi:MAG: cytidine deaminase [Candidatus Kapaibacterium sp.]|nr:MAG: cytidine deaminase [Candidatus Kapabacteria bacterium]
MTTPQHFLHHAELFQTSTDQLFAGLYAESAHWAASQHGNYHASYHAEAQSDALAAIHHLSSQLAKPLQHYTQLIAEAKQRALETRTRAHAPFSNFLVGATLIAEDESLFIGCNVECSSYGLTICAERTALVSGVAQGKKRYAGVVVAADTDELTPPCGACRQLLYDFAPDSVVVLVNLRGTEKRFTMKELLPEAFSVTFLQK